MILVTIILLCISQNSKGPRGEPGSPVSTFQTTYRCLHVTVYVLNASLTLITEYTNRAFLVRGGT